MAVTRVRTRDVTSLVRRYLAPPYPPRHGVGDAAGSRLRRFASGLRHRVYARQRVVLGNARRCALGVTAWTRLRSHAFASRGDDRPAGAWFAVARRPRSIRSVSTLWVHWVGLVLSNGSRPDRWRVNRVRELRVPNRRPPRRRGFVVVVGATRTDARRAAVAI